MTPGGLGFPLELGALLAKGVMVVKAAPVSLDATEGAGEL